MSAQFSNCPNLGFEYGDFTNWTGYTWVYSTEHPEVTTTPVEGLVPERHTIMTDNSAYDLNTNNELKIIPPGHFYSVRLGRDITESYSGTPRCWHQNMRYILDVDSNNAFLTIKFAVVLQYAADHLEVEEPRFRFTLYDQNGDTIPDCSNYNVYASNENVEGFNFSITPRGDQIMWRDWTTVGVDLSGYIGQSITVEFMTADCTQSYHYGYCYFVASCQPLNIEITHCAEDVVATLLAPRGFEEYRWEDSSGTVMGSSQALYIEDPVEGDVLTCTMLSATGCEVILSSTIVRYDPHADFVSNMIDCNSNTVQLTNLSSTSQGSLYYLWDFGDGNTSYDIDPQYTFSTSGRHQVSLRIINFPSSCADTIIKEVESFMPDLVFISGDTTYCPGESIYLKANGAYNYIWTNGSTDDSIQIGHPGGVYGLVGYSSTGCVSDTNYKTVIEEPPWEFLGIGDSVFCEGDSAYLMTSGAVDYLWNTGETTNSIYVWTPGTYTSTGINAGGCVKSHTFHIIESPLPDSKFSLSQYTLDRKNNELTGTVPLQANVQFIWDMDDGTFETGSDIYHDYDITYTKLYYTISLTATNNFGCVSTFSDIIDIIPYVPNIFSPNGDGINDLFMAELDLEIFDRHGTTLYKGNEGWDGKYKGQDLSPDTYFYAIDYSNREGQEHHIKGYVTLVR